MYVRFVIPNVDDDSGRRQGVFQAAYDLRRVKQLPDHRHNQLDHLLNWFRDHLDTPDRFSRSSRNRARKVAISWFKDSADDCVSRMHEICRILNEHGLHTEMLTSTRPGYIVFEDRQQIAAVPFSETTA